MIVEFLTFDVPSVAQTGWIEQDRAVWTPFLQAQAGFIHKELWIDEKVHVVIWWESMEAWKAITAEQVAAIDEQLGEFQVEPTMRSFSVVQADV